MEDKTPKQVKVLIDRINRQAKDLSTDMKVYESPVKHQRGDTECGIYSLFLLTELIKGKRKPGDFLGKRIPDSDMEKLRNEFFSSR